MTTLCMVLAALTMATAVEAGPVGALVDSQDVPGGYQWALYERWPTRYTLWRHSGNAWQQIGVYYADRHAYYRLADGRKCVPPVRYPAMFGREEFNHDLEKPYSVVRRGRREVVQRDDVLKMLGVDMPMRRRLRLTVTGDERLQAYDFLRSQLTKDWRIREYPADAWELVDVRFPTIGSPALVVQSHDGTVLHRQEGVKNWENTLAALRRADESYNPANDPDLRDSGGTFFMWLVVALACVLCGLIVPIVIKHQGKF